jgi:DNA-binding response OmpR family regulator
LVVEDEHKVTEALRERFEGDGYDLTLEHTGEGAFFRATTEFFDAILLDVMLPGRDGLTILTTLRSRGVKTPILLVTARDALDDRFRGLDSGADDYLVNRSPSPSCSRGSARWRGAAAPAIPCA